MRVEYPGNRYRVFKLQVGLDYIRIGQFLLSLAVSAFKLKFTVQYIPKLIFWIALIHSRERYKDRVT